METSSSTTGASLTVAVTLQRATKTLSNHSDSPRLDAELLLAAVLRASRSALIVRGADPIATPDRRSYAALIDRRLQGWPVAYLTGTREFWSLELDVTPAVLVPRPETEVLVELALGRLPAHRQAAVLDLGTGSGAIALALASERPVAQVTGVDVSREALAVAASNARKLGLSQIRWRVGSWYGAVPDERFDMIVANPPYIAAGDPALRNLAAEPALALSSGPTGLEALDCIAVGAAAHLRPGGRLLLEHGSTQADAVAGMLERSGFGSIGSHVDYSGRPRVTLGTMPHPR